GGGGGGGREGARTHGAPPVPPAGRQVGVGQPVRLPAGHVDHVHVAGGRGRGPGRAGRPVAGRCPAVQLDAVALRQVVQQEPDRHGVGEDVVQDDEEDVVVGGQPVQPHPYRRSAVQRQL